MSKIVNILKLLSDLEKFWLSSNDKGLILVTLGFPVNDIIYIQATKMSSYKDTCNNVLTKLKLYLSGICYVQEGTNVNSRIITNGTFSKTTAVNFILNQNITKYKHTYGLAESSVISN